MYNACATSRWEAGRMDLTDYIPLMIIGAVFLVVGITFLVLWRKEEREYCQTISKRTDVRKYLEHKSDSIQAWGLKVGGIISVAIGLVLLVMGAVFWGCS
jgi:ABC-type nickel/cobalt efflux system permease component RcnA